MPLDTVSGAGLIAGAGQFHGGAMKIVLATSILIGGQHQAAGTEIDVPDVLGRELLAGGRARIAAPRAAVAEPAAAPKSRAKA